MQILQAENNKMDPICLVTIIYKPTCFKFKIFGITISSPAGINAL